MSLNDQRKYPDFQYLMDQLKVDDINKAIDCVFISHFHLDHCAALPVLIETFQYTGPVYSSEPTKEIMPFMLVDYLRL